MNVTDNVLPFKLLFMLLLSDLKISSTLQSKLYELYLLKKIIFIIKNKIKKNDQMKYFFTMDYGKPIFVYGDNIVILLQSGSVSSFYHRNMTKNVYKP